MQIRSSSVLATVKSVLLTLESCEKIMSPADNFFYVIGSEQTPVVLQKAFFILDTDLLSCHTAVSGGSQELLNS